MAAEETIFTAFFSNGRSIVPVTIVESLDNATETDIVCPGGGYNKLVSLYQYGASTTHAQYKVGNTTFMLKTNAAALDFRALAVLNMDVSSVGQILITNYQ